jgi:hypothetical protein
VLPLADESGTPLVVPLLQASFSLDARGSTRLADEQPPIELSGVAWDDGDPDQGWRLEPQMAFVKPGCDIVLNAHALAPQRGCTQLLVELSLAEATRRALVFGPRRMLDGRRVTAPEPFERIALRHSQAFGGWDRRHPDPARQRAEPRNPAGRGFRDPAAPVDRDVEMPAIEDPSDRFERYGDAPAPVGFGFVPPHWQPRAAWAGTYDEQWLHARSPLLPLDFDRRFFAAASAGLGLARPLAGGEHVRVVGTTAVGQLDFVVPALGTPLVHAHMRGRRRTTLKMALDTLVIDTDAMSLTLTWRSHLPLRNGPHDLLAAEFHLPDPRARAMLRAGGGRHAALRG